MQEQSLLTAKNETRQFSLPHANARLCAWYDRKACWGSCYLAEPFDYFLWGTRAQCPSISNIIYVPCSIWSRAGGRIT